MPSTSPGERPRVLFLHAYSPSNSGDGLLVRLAIDIVRRAINEFDYHVIASDADGFNDPHVLQWRSPLALPGALRRASMLSTGLLGPSRELRQLAADADLIVAVGGAYLRGGGFTESTKSWGAHYGQLKLAAEHGHKTIYLPQSIGPYRGKYGQMTHGLLAQVSRVYARDDRTLADLSALRNVERTPDMAILEWARGDLSAPGTLHERSLFVARNLSEPRSYYSLLEQVRDSDQFDWAVQATGSANNDGPLTERYAGGAVPSLASVLADGNPRVVVSTRLHGSLSSLIAGYPTVHLSYERKGYSAFSDLGIPEYAISARDATLLQVQALVDQIKDDPGAYWASIEVQRDNIRAAERRIETRIDGVLLKRTP